MCVCCVSYCIVTVMGCVDSLRTDWSVWFDWLHQELCAWYTRVVLMCSLCCVVHAVCAVITRSHCLPRLLSYRHGGLHAHAE
jgi:hypothetical protein